MTNAPKHCRWFNCLSTAPHVIVCPNVSYPIRDGAVSQWNRQFGKTQAQLERKMKGIESANFYTNHYDPTNKASPQTKITLSDQCTATFMYSYKLNRKCVPTLKLYVCKLSSGPHLSSPRVLPTRP